MEKHVKTLAIIQNDCLRIVLGAYKATPVQVLEAEAVISPIQTQLDALVIRHQALRGVHPLTIEGNRIIRRRLRGKRGRARPIRLTPSLEMEEWALRELEAKDWDQAATATRKKAHWHDPESDVEEYQDVGVLAKKIGSWARKKWTEWWEAYQDAIPEHSRTPAQKEPLFGDRYNYHLKLRKAESSMAVQLRSGKNGFNHFLHKVKVPGVLSARCSYG